MKVGIADLDARHALYSRSALPRYELIVSKPLKDPIGAWLLA
jgi:hypothetical protein